MYCVLQVRHQGPGHASQVRNGRNHKSFNGRLSQHVESRPPVSTLGSLTVNVISGNRLGIHTGVLYSVRIATPRLLLSPYNYG